jgi:hypothetical protein
MALKTPDSCLKLLAKLVQDKKLD